MENFNLNGQAERNEKNVVASPAESHEAKLHHSVYGDVSVTGDGNDKAAEMLRQNEAFIKQINVQAERIASCVMKSVEALPCSFQQAFVDGIKKDLQPNDVAYHAFLTKWNAREQTNLAS